MNIQTPQDAVMGIYPALDQMQEVFKIMGSNFRVSSAAGDFPLPPDRVEVIKAQYMSLRSQIQKLAGQLPDVKDLG